MVDDLAPQGQLFFVVFRDERLEQVIHLVLETENGRGRRVEDALVLLADVEKRTRSFEKVFDVIPLGRELR